MKNTQISKKFIRYAVSAAEMRRCDETTIEHFGVSQMVLMERAALSLCQRVIAVSEKRSRIFIFCGSGNNGGDGIAAARLLFQEKFDVTVVCVNHGTGPGDGSKRSDACKRQLKSALKYGVKVVTFEEARKIFTLAKPDVIVDAMLGIGISRPIEGEYLAAVSLINEIGAYVIAADIPTGLNADNGKVMGKAVLANETATFGFAKLGLIVGMGTRYCGDVRVFEVGITEDGFLSEYPRVAYLDGASSKEDIEEILPKRDPNGNKGSFGKALIIAGSSSVSGALMLSAESCLRSGAGMVKVFTDKNNLHAVQTLLPEAMSDVYDSSDFDSRKAFSKLDSSLNWCDVIVCGPGLGTGEIGKAIVFHVLKSSNRPLILDADALNIIAEDKEIRELAINYPGEKIMTPHLAEFSRLCGKTVPECREDILELPIELAKEFHASIICKDAKSVVTDGENIALNLSGNDGMATAGSGDVLSGLLGALIAGYKDPFESAFAGAYLHGLAGDMARDRLGERVMTARDISEELRKIMAGNI